MAWRKIRRQHKLLFRYDPDQNVIEIRVRGRFELIRLEEYGPAQGRTDPQLRVDVAQAEGLDDGEQMC